MKRLTYLLLTVMIGFLATTYVAITPVSAAFDFDAYNGVAISDANIDGILGTEWDDAGHYIDVPIDPSGVAEIWTKHDGTNLYIAIKFDADSPDPWLTIQLGTTECMDLADAAIFGNNNLEASGYSDASLSFPSVSNDTTQDGVGNMSVGAEDMITIELKKPLNSGDSDGKDIAWSEGSTYNLVIAWDSNGAGSSGGGANHWEGTTPTERSILIDPVAIPEFSGLMFIAVLIALVIPVTILVKKTVPKPSTNINL